MNVDIRPMTRQDVPSVYAVERICFRTPWSKMALIGELRNDVAHYLVVEYEQRIVGYAGMWVLFDEAHITNVAILPAYRRSGFGTKLMLAMMELARLLGATAMTLEVRENNFGAQKMYEQLGFVQNGFRPRYYPDTGEGALLLWNMDIAKMLNNNGRQKEDGTV